MQKMNNRTKIVIMSRKLMSMPKYKIIFGILFMFILCLVVLSAYFALFFKSPAKTDVVKLDTTSKISVTTSKLVIKEWNIEASINENILGDVSYKMNSDKSSLELVSSKLNAISLSSKECVAIKITAGSWGLKRNIKKEKYNKVFPLIIGSYEYKRSFPADICDEVKEIDAAFNYLFINLVEKK